MKLAEALILRADIQKRIAQLESRLTRSAKVQEGEEPPEDPQKLIEDLENLTGELLSLIRRINRTNSVTPMGDRMLSDALAERDVLKLKYKAYNALINEASQRFNRYSLSEVRMVSTVNIADLQLLLDHLARDHRELDAKIQALNWQTELIEN
ncbi:DIP1984 family protein [Lyngbya sp. CCY1209]|uniref:DIP1984 family protein n=1 Tax=Lyngbya sp. CCY1209 TaxID=2886103 RepID=UPI002D204263|nr:DIP1984 family protein [Lyngbya sp. CCY1209]MEB3883039.1 DIP1984 family protein [Lyngbya sp. CCY1209]